MSGNSVRPLPRSRLLDAELLAGSALQAGRLAEVTPGRLTAERGSCGYAWPMSGTEQLIAIRRISVQ